MENVKWRIESVLLIFQYLSKARAYTGIKIHTTTTIP